ncbi:hypothetical protein ACIF80_22445 [Streptomyces sp. NPDC085927]|uniref:hypothetical protein n=1 Tax=Streptomyces sp. NPDC085927 TaxID=3365738 RepID=UPI0037D54162
MAAQHDDEPSHPLEQVTGERDVPPEEENSTRRLEERESDAGDRRDTPQGTEDTSGDDAS